MKFIPTISTVEFLSLTLQSSIENLSCELIWTLTVTSIENLLVFSFNLIFIRRLFIFIQEIESFKPPREINVIVRLLLFNYWKTLFLRRLAKKPLFKFKNIRFRERSEKIGKCALCMKFNRKESSAKVVWTSSHLVRFT